MLNFYKTLKLESTHNPYEAQHGIKLPFRGLICCASGGGKTNLVMNLLYQMNKTFHEIIIVSKAEEPLYDMIGDRLKQTTIHYNGHVPDVVKMDKNENGLIIFDDMVLTPNSKIGELFIRGRKMGYSCIYITQSYYGTPKIVRQNVSYIWLGKGIARRELKMILSEFALGNLTVDGLNKIYNDITRQNMMFMLIDTNSRTIKKNITELIYEY